MLGWMLAAAGLAVVAVNVYVYRVGAGMLVANAAPADAAIVLGAFVDADGECCPMLVDRLDTALDLYRAGKVPKILVSGDHGRKEYDEVNAMRRYLEARGVPPEDIFMDHAGFNTYNTMVRAAKVFQVRRAIVVTQRFHLPRALYLASGVGLQAEGVCADRNRYPDEYRLREMGARAKAFYNVALGTAPVFLGPVIPIDGDGRATQG